MKGDFTRITERRRFSGVRLQQGRVQLDADFNEQVEIDARRDRLTSVDTIGHCGVSDADAGDGLEIFATARLAGVDCFHKEARAVGAAETILASADGGRTWLAQPAPAGGAGDLHAVALCPDDSGEAVAVGARMLRQDGAGEWAEVALPPGPAGDLRAVCFGDEEHAWAVGDGAVILASEDAGQSWVVQKPPAGVDAALRGVYFRDAERGWAVGAGGTLLSSVDGGANWQRVEVPAGFVGDLNAIVATGAGAAEVVLAVGAGGALLRSADDGASWEASEAAGGADLLAIEALGPGLVLAVGPGPVAVAGSDAGTDWVELEVPGSGDLTAVAGSGAEAVAVGDLATALYGDGAGWQPAQLPATGAELGIHAGRIYVEGTMAEVARSLRLGAQPYLPGFELPAEPGRYLVYVDVWERHLTALEDADLREVALGGPDTATRTQTVWQARLAGPYGADAGCGSIDLDSLPDAAPSGELRARGEPAPPAAGECMVPEDGGYRRLENQLYRVEVIERGAAGSATFAWSRDNGAILSRLQRVDPDPGGDANRSILTLAAPGRDEVQGFAGTDFVVELSSEGRVLRGEPGLVLDVVAGDGSQVTVEYPAGTAALQAEFGVGTTVRRWEGHSPLVSNGWQPLEDGVEVQFGPGSYGTGDYWTIPARTIDASVEWPSVDGAPSFERRHGTEHGRCPLAVVERGGDGTWSVVGDCRPLFTPLADQTRIGMAGGDGQELPAAGPGATLAHQIEAMVMNGRRPVKGAKVRFTIEQGNGLLGWQLQEGETVEAETDEHGIAGCDWRLDRSARLHRVRAELLDGSGAPVGSPLHFNAGIAAAGGGPCTVTARPGDDLQEALEQLRDGGGELCLVAGEYALERPLQMEKLSRVVISGRGSATVLRSAGSAAIYAEHCRQVEFRRLRIETGPEAGEHAAALTLSRSGGITVGDCEFSVPDQEREGGEQRACIATVNGSKELEEDVTIARCRLEVGLRQAGIEVAGTHRVRIVDNLVITPELESGAPFWPGDGKAAESYAMATGILVRDGGDARIERNEIGYAIHGVLVESMQAVWLADNSIGCSVKPQRSIADAERPVAIQCDSVAILRATGNSATLLAGWAETVEQAKLNIQVPGVEVKGDQGPFLLIRDTELVGFPVGVRVEPDRKVTETRGRREDGAGANPEGAWGNSMWLVAETFADGAIRAIQAPKQISRERNFGTFLAVG